ncbi:MAG: DUF2142 domain-containing protein, partial [Oscillospiraceae bacterium]|nr:DUF2142 domain-containing protein [Oscillospiraceae bacterium]
EFSLKISFFSVGVNFNVINTSLDGTLHATLHDADTQQILMDYTGNLGAISTTSYTVFNLDTPVTEEGMHNYVLSLSVDYLTPEVTQGQMLSLKKSSVTAKDFGTYSENGTVAEGSLAMLIVNEMIGHLPIRYYMYVGIGCSFAAGILMLVYIAMPKRKTLAVFLTLLTVCTAYQFVLPVYSSPDEITHYNTAYKISNGWLGVESESNKILPMRDTDTKTAFTDYNTSAFTYRYIMNHFGDKVDGSEKMDMTTNKYLRGYRFPYLLSAAGITAGRMMNLGGVATAMLARFLNTLFFCGMITAAWYFAPVAKLGFVAAAMLPMTIHVGASVSYDCFIISMAFLLTAVVLNFIMVKQVLDWKKLLLLGLLCIMIAPLKSAYILIPLIIVAIPSDRFKNKKLAYAFKTVVLVLCCLHFMRYTSGKISGVVKKSSRQIAQTTVAETAAETAVAEGTKKISNFTIGYMLKHPGVLLKMVISTFFENFTFYFNSMIGGYLGYLNLSEVTINPLMLSGFIIILILAFVRENEETPLMSIPVRLLAVAVFAGTLAILVGACITWTPMDYTTIWGFQGRYLLPVLPLIMIALQSKGLTKTKDLTTFILCSLFTLNIFTVLNAFIVILSR